MTNVGFSKLIKTLVKPLVKEPSAITVTERDSNRYHEYVLDVAPSDVGRVIGRQGHVASALRTVVEGARDKRINDKKIRLIINDHRH
ncbi:KH domain-containing protein [Limosilactobacillus coleohominis]|uniref:KH domain-containing protein n=1 Tax=Limosilactobacillus coleohominis TaxID=181675 RepID=UPI0026F0A1E4|nr:KH domain-containing protein [Limosilactobacillus coleohominis]